MSQTHIDTINLRDLDELSSIGESEKNTEKNTSEVSKTDSKVN